MREAAGQTVKSAISHSYIIDTRDDRITANKGYYGKIFNEFAGLGGDASFYKSELEGQISRPIFDGIVRLVSLVLESNLTMHHQSFSVAARTGFLWGISRPTLFSDRFQLGGPTSVRAFRANSMGPRDGCTSIKISYFLPNSNPVIADSLGGDLHWSGGASIISNIPRKPHWPVKTHVWVNAGRLDAIDKSTCLPLTCLYDLTPLL